MTASSQPIDKSGLLYAIGCYAFWGLFPIFWKLLSHIDALETLMHRIIWAFVSPSIAGGTGSGSGSVVFGVCQY